MVAKTSKNITDVAPRPVRRADFGAKRMDMLRKAALAFAADGYHQTSMGSLAARMGVSKPFLYYYAESKDDLLFQCVQFGQDQLKDAMERTERTDMDGLQRLRHFFSAYAEIMCGDFGRCLALVDVRALSPETRKNTVTSRRGTERRVRQLIMDGQADGSIGECDPVLTARALFGAFNGIPRWYRGEGALHAKEIATVYLDLLTKGLQKR